MFAPRYFGVRHFGARYFAPGSGDVVQQPIPSSGSAPAGGHRRRRPLPHGRPVWEFFEDELLRIIERHKPHPDNFNAVQRVSIFAENGDVERLAGELFKLERRGFDANELLGTVGGLSGKEHRAVEQRLQQRRDDESIAVLLLDGGL